MQVQHTEIPDVRILEPRVYGDERGYFFEAYNRAVFSTLLDADPQFVQDNQSRSAHGVLRGLHYQIQQPQGKLVRVLSGEIFDVAVDIRRSSPTFGRWVAARLSAQNNLQVWVPEGFAHGFYVTSDFAEVLYKTTDFYAPEHERSIQWNDPDLAIDWPIEGAPNLSNKDLRGVAFRDAEVFA